MADVKKLLTSLDLIRSDCEWHNRPLQAAAITEAITLIGSPPAEIDRLRVAFARLAAKSSQQQAEIERLARPMTLDEARSVLNDYGYGCGDINGFSDLEVSAIAEKIEREKEAANG